MKTHQNSQLSTLLNENEELIWEGSPKAGLSLNGNEYFLIGWGLFVIIMMSFWFESFTRSVFSEPWIPILFITVFIVLQIGIRLAISWHRRKYAVYGVTNHRIIIKLGKRVHRIESIALNDLPNIELRETRNGYGTISFFKKSFANFWGFGSGGRRIDFNTSLTNSLPTFELIPNAKKVYNKILALKQK